jgi:hypothetical protein
MGELASSYTAYEWRDAFLSLESLVGRSLVESLIEALDQYGIDLSKNHVSIKVEDMRMALTLIFGDAGEMLIDRLARYLTWRRRE